MSKKDIKEFISNHTLTKSLYHIYMSIKNIYKHRKREKGRKAFDDKGVQTIFQTQKIISEYNEKVDFIFAFGTALGIIRDGKLLSRDMDIDMIAFIETDHEIEMFRNYMVSKGYIRLHSCIAEPIGILQDSFLFNDIMVDIHYARQNNGQYNTYLLYDLPEEKNKVLIFSFSTRKIKAIQFHGHMINVPEDISTFLTEIYGEDWKIPNSHYTYWENEKTIKTDMIGRFVIIKKYKYC